jgi:hypothetical protein
MKTQSFRQRLSLAINRGARVTLHSPNLIERDRLAMRKAQCETFASNNPRPRAAFYLEV